MSLKNPFSKIPKIGLGTGTGFESQNKYRDKKLISLIRGSVNLGLKLIDTAEVYFDGHAEVLIGTALKKIRKKIFIATKFSPQHNSYKDVIRSCEESLRRLQTDYIDLYQIHWPNPNTDIEETVAAMEKLVKIGKIRYVGISNFSLRQLKIVRGVLKFAPLVSLQTEYNLLDRTVEDFILPYCQKNNITLISYSPLNAGAILKNPQYLEKLNSLSKKYSVTASQIILNWIVSHKNVIAIPGTTNIGHVKENFGSLYFKLSASDKFMLNNVFKQNIIYVPVQDINVLTSGNHKAYQTLQQALSNKLNFFPSPLMLSEEVYKGDFLKPVKLQKSESGKYKYDLVGGRIRYWAWVIAHKGKKPISAIVE